MEFTIRFWIGERQVTLIEASQHCEMIANREVTGIDEIIERRLTQCKDANWKPKFLETLEVLKVAQI